MPPALPHGNRHSTITTNSSFPSPSSPLLHSFSIAHSKHEVASTMCSRSITPLRMLQLPQHAGVICEKSYKMMLQQLEAVQGGGVLRIVTVAKPAAATQKKLGLRCRVTEPSGKPAPMGQKTCYKDSWMDNLLINFTVHRLSKITGMSTSVKGYDGFVEVTRKVMQTRSPFLQRATTMRVLHSAIPPWLLKLVRRFLPNTPKTAERLAAGTRDYTEWLVGPCEVKEVDVDGAVQNSGVLIKKCRYLEASNCVGLCVNMCKIPTQDFFTNSLGVPLTMTPNFEDMSCEMIFGKASLSIEDDPALQQPCFTTLCPTAHKKAVTCPKRVPPAL